MRTKTERRIWIIGAGRVGARALEALSVDGQSQRIWTVDTKPAQKGDHRHFQMDGIAFLSEHLDATTEARIVPAVPIHLAFEWLKDKLADRGRFISEKIPFDLQEAIPFFAPSGSHRAYVSNATFTCPVDCDEPDLCTVTGEPRPLVMHRHLTTACKNTTCLVVRSEQLAPGVGGVRARDLWAAYEKVLANPGAYLLATACRCHGVVDAFSFGD